MIILNFHGVGPLSRDVDAGEKNCWLDIALFESILDHVQGRKNVQITFDDGNVSDFEIVLPALVKRGMKADFFICSGRIGLPTFLNSTQILSLKAAGMGLGSHGIHHRPWRTLADNELMHELTESRQTLERLSRQLVDAAACPFGSYDWRVVKALKHAGYRVAYTSDGGPSRGAEWLRARNTINRTVTIADIERILKYEDEIIRPSFLWLKKFLKRLRPSTLH